MSKGKQKNKQQMSERKLKRDQTEKRREKKHQTAEGSESCCREGRAAAASYGLCSTSSILRSLQGPCGFGGHGLNGKTRVELGSICVEMALPKKMLFSLA